MQVNLVTNNEMEMSAFADLESCGCHLRARFTFKGTFLKRQLVGCQYKHKGR